MPHKDCVPTVEPRTHINRCGAENDRRKVSSPPNQLSVSSPSMPSSTTFTQCPTTLDQPLAPSTVPVCSGKHLVRSDGERYGSYEVKTTRNSTVMR
jgi:hypothetical protein